MRLFRLIAIPSAVVALMFALAGAPAQAVETGVVINGPEGLSMQSVHQVAGLGVGWVRVFAAWNIFEPNRGHLNEPEIATLEEGLAALPKGTKVIVDVVNTPNGRLARATLRCRRAIRATTHVSPGR